jgi:hypothetical protein
VSERRLVLVVVVWPLGDHEARLLLKILLSRRLASFSV